MTKRSSKAQPVNRSICRVRGGTHASSIASSLFLLGTVLLGQNGCDCVDGPLDSLVPAMRVTPVSVDVEDLPITQDFVVQIQILNPSQVELELDGIGLSADSDPAFEIVSSPTVVAAGDFDVVVVKVRPVVVGTIQATLEIDAEEDAEPNFVEVPISVGAGDFGVPDLLVTPVSVDFDTVGKLDVVRATVTMRNEGVRDLVIDETRIVPTTVDDASIRITVPASPGLTIGPGESTSLDLVFSPQDTEVHTAALEIFSNDPDGVVTVPLSGQGKDCPVAVIELLEDPLEIEPQDTLRFLGTSSYAVTPDTVIESYEWILVQRPVGSTATVKTPALDRTELDVDLAGDYALRLVVTDSIGVASCDDVTLPFSAVPTDELHIQLVWDHPTADLDLHVLREGGEVFTHEGDAYFSNKTPEWFTGAPASNPTLDVDDGSGYGPENTNIETPIPGSRWTILVHYWDKKTAGDGYTNATLRIFAKGQGVASLERTFDDDETLWSAAEIQWPSDPLELPTITPIGIVVDYPRPF